MAARPGDSLTFEIEKPPGPLFRWRQVAQALPLLLAIAAALIIYLPALDAPFFEDDYVYLYAAKSLSFGDYAHAALVPHSNDPVLVFTRDFWRPLYFLSFRVLEPIFGGRVAPYHLLLVGIHLAGITLVWLLARRLTRRWEAAAVAATVFAVHPASVEAVAWISSLNNAGLPIALAAWLALVAAIESREGAKRNWLLGLSVLLVAVAIGFRETAIVIIPALGAWYLLVPARAQLREPRTYSVLVPFFVVAAASHLVRTRMLTEPYANPFMYQWGDHVPDRAWYMLKLAFGPYRVDVHGWREMVGAAGGVAILAAVPVALVTRRWLLLALLAAFGASLAPFAPVTFWLEPRYFYFSSAFFALAAGVVVAEALDLGRRLWSMSVGNAVLVAGLVAVLVVGAVLGVRRERAWESERPDLHQDWIDQLRATYPTLPEGGTLYAVNTPFVLALFDAFVLLPTVNYSYDPGVGRVVHIDAADLPSIRARLGPDDRVFIYSPGRSQGPVR